MGELKQRDDESLLAIAERYSVLGHRKLAGMMRLLREAGDVPGAAAELGVYRGGAAYLIASMLRDRPVYLFDTFAGLPETDDAFEQHAPGDFGQTSPQAVARLLESLPNARLRVGVFPATALGLEDERFAFVHLDGDYYRSTIDALQFFYPRMTAGGIILLDDYTWPRCPGIAMALADNFGSTVSSMVDVGEQYQAIVRRVVPCPFDAPQR